MLFKRSQKDMRRQLLFVCSHGNSTSWIEMVFSDSGKLQVIHSFQQVAVELLGPVPEIVLWYLLTMVFDAVLSLDTNFTQKKPLEFSRFHTRLGPGWLIVSHAWGDARGGSNPTSCQQRDKNSDPPCSSALALAAQSKRNITMQWCWCNMPLVWMICEQNT